MSFATSLHFNDTFRKRLVGGQTLNGERILQATGILITATTAFVNSTENTLRASPLFQDVSWGNTYVVTPFQRGHVAGKLTFLRRVLGGRTSVVTIFRGRHVAGKSIYFAFALRVLIYCVSVFVFFLCVCIRLLCFVFIHC